MNDPYRNHSSFLCYTNASVYHTILVSQVICQLYNKVMRPIALSLCLHCCFSPTKPSFIKTKSFDFRFWQTEDSSAVLISLLVAILILIVNCIVLVHTQKCYLQFIRSTVTEKALSVVKKRLTGINR